MTILIIIGVIVVVLFLAFILKSTSLGQSYKKYLQETQSSLLLRRFPKLTQGDLYDIQTTSAGDLARWILQQEYYSLYIEKQYGVLEKLMDAAMEGCGDYLAIDDWIKGRITKQNAIYMLRERDPQNYRFIFENELRKISSHSLPWQAGEQQKKHPQNKIEDNSQTEFFYKAVSEKVDSAYTSANTKFELGDYKGAIDDYNKSIHIYSNEITYTRRGFAKYNLGDYQGALQDFSKAIELNPNSAVAYNYKGMVNGVKGYLKIAILDFQKAIELNPNYEMAYINMGTAKINLGDHKGALQYLNKAIELNPNSAVAYYNKGVAKFQLGDYYGAKEDFDKAIILKPNDTLAYRNRGITKIALGQKESGCLDLSKAGELGDITAYDLIKKHCY